MDHRHSLTSDTTYHSFNDIELYEPASPPNRKKSTSSKASHSSSSSHSPSRRKRHSSHSTPRDDDDRPPTAYQMKRQDSGYESYTSTPRVSSSHSRPMPPRRTSTSNVNSHFSTSSKPRSRPSTRRSVKYYNPHQAQQATTSSLYVVRSPITHSYHASPSSAANAAMEASSSAYFHFPSPDPHPQHLVDQQQHPNMASVPPPQHPPQTTHYWTSDRTRRLEYAAMDAASRGVKGWIRKNLLPDCFVSHDDRHVAFDDDTGSVRRYRLELEDDVLQPSSPLPSPLDGGDEKGSSRLQRRKTWNFWNTSSKRG